MPRVDVWDIPDPEVKVTYDLGFKRGLDEKYDFEIKLGEGGFGSVRVVRSKKSGVQYACKSISKALDVPGLAPSKQQQHLENLRREIAVLRKLRGTLNVVHLEEVLEDDTHVHIIMEWCRGGDLFQKIGGRHYSEQTAASYMRAVLRTIAQCHAHRILHRDIKPGNFMLLSDKPDAPVKAIDFGLAVFYEPKKLPLGDLGLEGTPWYMAPEVLSSAVVPASDIWAAGVMAYQMLCGRFPFDDWDCPEAPRLSVVWKGILGEEPRFVGKAWAGISEKAQDFCSQLLHKDPAARPTAREALSHPWLAKGRGRGAGLKQRAVGDQLGTVVQRLQRYSQQNAFKKTVLDMMANELLSRHLQLLKEEEEEMAEREGEGQEEGEEDGVQDMEGLEVGGTPAADASPPGNHQNQQQQQQQGPGGSVKGRSALTAALAEGGNSQHGRRSYATTRQPRASKDGSMHGEGSVHSVTEGSVHRSMRSMRGAAAALSALEALRRARERRSAADLGQLAAASGGAAAAAGGGAGVEAGSGAGLHPTSPAVRIPSPSSAATAAGALSGYRGPVKDPGAASAWDFSFMANRLALEGSAHGNPHAARLLRARLSQETTRPPGRIEGTWHGPSTAPAAPSPFAAAASGSPLGAAAATAAAGGDGMGSSGSPPLGEGLQLGHNGTQRAASINVAILQQQQALLAQHAEQQAAAMTRAASNIDRSWHAGAVSGVEAPRADFQQFLEQAKKQRQEQRKVARLVLESSTHGGRRFPDPAAAGSGLNGLSDGAQEGSKHGGLLGAVRGMLHSVSGVFKHGGSSAKSPDGSRRGNSLLPMPSSSRGNSLLPTPGGGSRVTAAAGAAASSSSQQSPSGTPLPTTSSAAAAAPGVSSMVRPGRSLLPMPASSSRPPATGGRHALLPVPGGASRPAAGAASQPPPPAAATSAGSPVGVPTPGSRQPVAAAAVAGPAHTPVPAPAAAGGLSHAPMPIGMVEPTQPNGEGPPLEQGKRGQGAYAALMAAACSEASIPPADSAAESKLRSTVKQVGFAEAPSIHTISLTPEVSTDNNLQTGTPPAGPAQLAHAHSLAAKLQAVEASGGCGAGAAPLQDVRQVLQQMFAGEHDLLTVEQLQARLEGLGHRLAPSEVAHLARQVGLGDGDVVGLSQFAASQLEWGDMQVNHRDEWLSCLRATFEDLDKDRDGKIGAEDIIRVLAGKLPEAEVNAALEDVLLEAAAEEDEGLDWAAFQALLSLPPGGAGDSLHGLDQYDARLLRPGDVSSPEGTGHGGADAAAVLGAAGRRSVG